MSRRLQPTFADYVAIAVSPALIMVLVGSLVFFLIEVCYQGPFNARLSFIMAMFVMAAVCIGRLSIREGREYATLFALPLGIVTVIALTRFVQFSGPLAGLSIIINIGLIVLIWWLADKLTWDCTVIDESEDASGEGLLQTAGLDKEEGDHDAAQTDSEPEATRAREAPPPATDLWQKFVQYRRRPHAPGVWVIYFSLAALPIFGLGQWFIPAADLAGRRYVFKLLAAFVAAALGLLLTTSFLGLRRYLRQRRLEMPQEMAAAWMGVGAAMIVALLVVCAMLPRRNPEYSVRHLPFFARSPDDLSKSKWGPFADGPEEEDADRTVQRDDATRQQEGDRNSGGQQESKNAKGGSKQGDNGEKSEGEESDGEKSGGQKSGDKSQGDSSKDKSSEAKGDEKKTTGQQREGDRDEQESSPDGQSGRSNILGNLGSVMGLLIRLIYWLLVILFVGYLLWKYWDQVREAVRNFIRACQEFWQRLFGGRPQVVAEVATEAVANERPPRPFSDFSDPFVSGMADRSSADELIRYTFAAFEAWAYERGFGREPEQTPHEFALAASRYNRDLGRDAARLAELYCWSAYGNSALPNSTVEHLRRFWKKLDAAGAVPVG